MAKKGVSIGAVLGTVISIAAVLVVSTPQFAPGVDANLEPVAAIDAIITTAEIRYSPVSAVPTTRQSYVAKYHSSGIRPGIILLHGGYWYRGKRRYVSSHVQRFLEAGYNVFTPHYRYSMMDMALVESVFWNNPADRAYYSAQRDDVAQAVNHIKAQAAQYRTDPNKLILAGISAGGHLALDYALQGNAAKVRAVASFSGAISPLRIQLSAPWNSSYEAQHLKDSAFGLYGCNPAASSTCRRRWENGEPLLKVSPNDPPTMITNNTAEFVSPHHAKLLYDAQTKAGARSILNYYRSTSHATSPRVISDFLSFCSRVLNNRLPTNRILTLNPK